MPKIDETREFIPVNIALLTVSDTRTLKDDRSGDILFQRASDDGHVVVERAIVKDEVHLIKKKLNIWIKEPKIDVVISCLLYTSPSPRDRTRSRMPSSA